MSPREHEVATSSIWPESSNPLTVDELRKTANQSCDEVPPGDTDHGMTRWWRRRFPHRSTLSQASTDAVSVTRSRRTGLPHGPRYPLFGLAQLSRRNKKLKSDVVRVTE
jgi:hypothetical protein